MANKGKEFTFPRNVTKSYEVFRGFTLLQLLMALPGALIGIVIVILPPNGFYPTIIKIWVPVILVVLTLVKISRKPVKARPNITASKYDASVRQFKQMQKLYYLKPKERRSVDASQDS